MFLARMLSRKIPALRPVDHVPELEGGHGVIAAMIVIETTVRTSMLLLAEEPDRRAKFLIMTNDSPEFFALSTSSSFVG